jgi:hypothetical protein
MQIVNQLPWSYLLCGLVWSLYQGVRGIVEQRRAYKDREKQTWDQWERVMILYIHDFAFRFVCTAAGFVALYVSYFLAKDLTALTTGSSLLLILSFLIGIIGVGGQLHYVILLGTVPFLKAGS